MGRCTVVKSATIVKRSWNQKKCTLPWPWKQQQRHRLIFYLKKMKPEKLIEIPPVGTGCAMDYAGKYTVDVFSI
jgi:hypothetical protein